MAIENYPVLAENTWLSRICVMELHGNHQVTSQIAPKGVQSVRCFPDSSPNCGLPNLLKGKIGLLTQSGRAVLFDSF